MHRISLANEFLEGSNNVYLIEGDETVLIDAGSDTPAARTKLVDGFDAADQTVGAIDRIYVTHYHIDHCGLLEWLVAESDASVHAHPKDRRLIEGNKRAWRRMNRLRHEQLNVWGVPVAAIDRLDDTLHEGADWYGDVTVEPVSDGTQLDVGGTELRAIHTPGHSLGHLSFAFPDRNEVVTGDALLPVYTPNVGGADVRVEEPLTRYIETLERLAEAEFSRAWPGHREPIAAPTDRAEEIITHHEKRAVQVLGAVAERERATPWEVSHDLFGDLDGVHILHGPGEAYAHLDHLTLADALVREDSEYTVTAETERWLRENDADRWSFDT